MPAIGPLKHKDLVAYLRKLGFHGPYGGGKHLIMQKGDHTIRIPNPHRGDISNGLISRLLRDWGISRGEWEAL